MRGTMPFRWEDDYGARLGVLRRADPFGEVRCFDIDPCYVFPRRQTPRHRRRI